MSLREVNALLAVVALGLLLFRTISTWLELHRSTRVLAVLLGVTLAVGAVGSWALSRARVVDTHLSTTVSWSLLVVRTAVVLVCVFWPRCMGLPPHRKSTSAR